jgi:hypothetical protein
MTGSDQETQHATLRADQPLQKPALPDRNSHAMLSSLDHYEMWNLAIRKHTHEALPNLTLL